MISENLYIPPNLSEPLSQVVHNKTGGIILFVINFLKVLIEEGSLRFNLTSRLWEYNIEQIQRRALDEEPNFGVTHYLSAQMARLDHKVQLSLKVAACFGFQVDADTLESALQGLKIDVDVLDDIVLAGFLQKLKNKYLWAHDVVRQVS